MNDELRESIARALIRDAFGLTTKGAAYRQADAVIEALGLSVTGGVIVGCLHDPPPYCTRCGIPHTTPCRRPADV